MINQIIISVVFTFLFSQIIKFITLLLKREKYAVEALYREYGGMPSTHTAVVLAVVFSVYFLEGLSNLFFVSLVFAFVIIIDVIDSKWFYGKRDKILNQLISKHDCSKKDKIQAINGEFGHSILEVLVGGLIAFGVSLIVSLL